jgi:hypothetical protein
MAKKEIYRGEAVGGPVNGQTLESRSTNPRGIVLVDKPRERAAIYLWDGEGEFRHVHSEGEDDADGWRSLDQDKRLLAGLGNDWEVRAHDDAS